MFSLADARAYSLNGPVGNGGDSWQIDSLSYGPQFAPKNLGEEYRVNTPIMFFSPDANFLDYFGSNGVVALSNAFDILNALTNVDNYSAMLGEFPLDSRHLNYSADVLGLYDLKSYTLATMMRQLGLENPVQWTWGIHDRYELPNTQCPAGMEYLVVQRNFDYFSTPLNQLQYSAYVNNVLYSYYITEYCQPTPPLLAITTPYSVDPTASEYSPVAASLSDRGDAEQWGIYYGQYFSGLTRDDMAGFRYLISTNNVLYESPPPDALVVVTNIGSETLLTTSNLYTLLSFAQTNDPSLTAANFGVTVTGTNYFWTYVTNWSYYLAPIYGEPAGSETVASNISSVSLQENFQDTFGNVITNGNLTNFPGVTLDCNDVILNYSSNTPALLQTVSFQTSYGEPAGSGVATTNLQPIKLNTPSGEYFILPNTSSNQCGWQFLCQPPGYSITSTTNIIATATNTITIGTNTSAFVGSISIITTFTNHTYVVKPIFCADEASVPALYQGVGRIQYIQADYDSLLGQTFQPITNDYTMVMVTNSRTMSVDVQRVVTTPDFLFSALDEATGSGAPPVVNVEAQSINFDQANVPPGLAGPGTITPPTTISFEKVGPVFFNITGQLTGTPYFTDLPGDGSAASLIYDSEYFVWSSFDGTTNAPIVYPNGTSLANLESEVLTVISPATLPTLTENMNYTNIATFTATGGAFTPPFTWSATGLPSNLTITSGGVLQGTPTETGTFDFTLILTDYLGRTGQWTVPITIQP